MMNCIRSMLVATVCALTWIGAEVARADDPAPLRIVDVGLFWQAPAIDRPDLTEATTDPSVLQSIATAPNGDVFAVVTYSPGWPRLYKISAAGDELWQYDLLPPNENNIAWSLPRIAPLDDGGAVVCDGIGRLHRVDARGVPIWIIDAETKNRGYICLRLVALDQDRIAIASSPYHGTAEEPWEHSFLLQMIDGGGQLRWRYQFHQKSHSIVLSSDLIVLEHGDLLSVIDTLPPDINDHGKWSPHRWQLRFSPLGAIRRNGAMDRSVPDHAYVSQLRTQRLYDGTLLRIAELAQSRGWRIERWSADAQHRLMVATSHDDASREWPDAPGSQANDVLYSDVSRYCQMLYAAGGTEWFVCYSYGGKVVSAQADPIPETAAFDFFDPVERSPYYPGHNMTLFAIDPLGLKIYRGRIAE